MHRTLFISLFFSGIVAFFGLVPRANACNVGDVCTNSGSGLLHVEVDYSVSVEAPDDNGTITVYSGSPLGTHQYSDGITNYQGSVFFEEVRIVHFVIPAGETYEVESFQSGNGFVNVFRIAEFVESGGSSQSDFSGFYIFFGIVIFYGVVFFMVWLFRH